MNYIEIAKKRSPAIQVEVYDPKVSYFGESGSLSIRRILDSMFCDSGIEFFCCYKDSKLNFTTEDIAINKLYDVVRDARITREGTTIVPIYKKLNTSIGATLDVTVIKGTELTIDLILNFSDSKEVVIEVTLDNYAQMLKTIE